MARKQRDYRAEQQRRNELARERGFTSRGQERHRKATGRIERLSPAAQKFIIGYKTLGIESKNARPLPVFGDRISGAQRAEDWSDIYARSGVAQYTPNERPSGMTKREYTDAYLAAFVVGDERYVNVRRSGGSEALRHWFVDIQGYMQADEYESRYGKATK